MNDEAKDVLARFYEELKGPTGDGQGKRKNGKPPWYIDPDHHRAMFSHYHKWLKGELVDEDSGKHPLVHMAWRALAIACQETGNVPKCTCENTYSCSQAAGCLFTETFADLADGFA